MNSTGKNHERWQNCLPLPTCAVSRLLWPVVPHRAGGLRSPYLEGVLVGISIPSPPFRVVCWLERIAPGSKCGRGMPRQTHQPGAGYFPASRKETL